jgi:hypothetical protein
LTQTTDKIETSAEYAENAVLPQIHEVHADPETPCPKTGDLPAHLQQPVVGKSPAQWAYERLALYIQNFEAQLDAREEVAMGFTGGDAGVIRIEGMGYFDPDILTFYGANDDGRKTQIVQHVSQLNVMLMALPTEPARASPTRIGFRLGPVAKGHKPVKTKR